MIFEEQETGQRSTAFSFSLHELLSIQGNVPDVPKKTHDPKRTLPTPRSLANPSDRGVTCKSKARASQDAIVLKMNMRSIKYLRIDRRAHYLCSYKRTGLQSWAHNHVRNKNLLHATTVRRAFGKWLRPSGNWWAACTRMTCHTCDTIQRCVRGVENTPEPGRR